jgi:hypothetical protein
MYLRTVRVFRIPLSWHALPRNPTNADNISGLFANVYRPAGVTEKSNLPVVAVSTRVILNDGLVVSKLFLPVLLWRSFRVW